MEDGFMHNNSKKREVKIWNISYFLDYFQLNKSVEKQKIPPKRDSINLSNKGRAPGPPASGYIRTQKPGWLIHTTRSKSFPKVYPTGIQLFSKVCDNRSSCEFLISGSVNQPRSSVETCFNQKQIRRQSGRQKRTIQ